MDVPYQTQKIGVCLNRFAPERSFEKRPGSSICLIDRFCICVEHITKTLTRCSYGRSGLHWLQPDQQMEMIAEQAVRIGVGDRCYMTFIEVQKVGVVTLFAEQLLAIIATIVDVIVCPWLE